MGKRLKGIKAYNSSGVKMFGKFVRESEAQAEIEDWKRTASELNGTILDHQKKIVDFEAFLQWLNKWEGRKDLYEHFKNRHL